MTRRLAYHAPETVRDAVRALAAADVPAVIGGGTMVVPELRRRELDPSAIIDLRRVRELKAIGSSNGVTTVGATVTYAEVLRRCEGGQLDVAPFADAARRITGGPQIRSQGTLGGSAAYANPASDIPAVLVGLEAQMLVVGAGGERTVHSADFFRGPFATALRNELLAGFQFKRANLAAWGHSKLKFWEGGWPIVTAFCAVRRSSGSRLRWRIGLGGVAPTPLALEVADYARARSGSPSADTLMNQLITETKCATWSDVFADADYRRQVAGVVAARALTEAADRLESRR